MVVAVGRIGCPKPSKLLKRKHSQIQWQEALDKLSETRNRLLAEIRKAVVGQDEVIEELLISLLARGHCLLTGIPGLGKTLLVKTVANCLSLGFKRIQFTPDLMPADVLGSEVVDEDPGHGKLSFRFVPGPIFSQVVLADEINRTPPKTQAALLEAMEERQVTVVGKLDRSIVRLFLPLKTRSSWRALIHCPKLSWIASS